MKEGGTANPAEASGNFRRDPFSLPSSFGTESARECAGSLGPVTRRKSRDETRSRRQVTRRDEARDGLVYSVSRSKVTRRDEIRDQINKRQNFDLKYLPNCNFRSIFFSVETNNFARDRLARRDEIETVSSRLFSRRDRFVTGPTQASFFLPPPPSEISAHTTEYHIWACSYAAAACRSRQRNKKKPLYVD